MHRASCRFWADDLAPVNGSDTAAKASQPFGASSGALSCRSKDAEVTLRCANCPTASPPLPFATLGSVLLKQRPAIAGHVALACQSPSAGRFLVQMPS